MLHVFGFLSHLVRLLKKYWLPLECLFTPGLALCSRATNPDVPRTTCPCKISSLLFAQPAHSYSSTKQHLLQKDSLHMCPTVLNKVLTGHLPLPMQIYGSSAKDELQQQQQQMFQQQQQQQQQQRQQQQQQPMFQQQQLQQQPYGFPGPAGKASHSNMIPLC